MNFQKLAYLSLFAAGGICFAAEPHPSLPAAGTLDGFGVNIHFTHEQPGELKMIRDAGFKWIRMDLTWNSTEKERGKYDFSAYDHLVEGLDKEGLKAYFILDYGNALYATPEEKHPLSERAGEEDFRAAYARWAAAAVKHFSGKGYLWEIWNEPNISGFWKPKPDANIYSALANAACAEIAKVAPDEAIIGAATSGVDLDFLETCFKAGLLEHWAAVSVHPYRQTLPETATEDYGKLKGLIARYAPKGKTIPILSGEWGYSTAYPCMIGKTDDEAEKMQADYLLRMMLTNSKNGIPLSIWYDWRDDGDNPKEAEHRFGIVRRAYRPGQDPVFEPKPAYLQMERFTKLAGGNDGVTVSEALGVFQSLQPDSVSMVTPTSGRPAFAGDVALKVFADGDNSVEATASIEATGSTEDFPSRTWTVKFKSAKGWRYFDVTCPPQEIPDLPGGKRASAMGWWVYGDGGNTELRLRFIDATGQTFQSAGPKVDFKGWQFVTLPLVHREDIPLGSWGGADDGNIHYPIRLTSPLLIDNVSRDPVEGMIRIASPVLIY